MKTREHSDLYLTYDSYKNVLHATRSNNGTDGFLRYLHNDAEHIIREGHNMSIPLPTPATRSSGVPTPIR